MPDENSLPARILLLTSEGNVSPDIAGPDFQFDVTMPAELDPHLSAHPYSILLWHLHSSENGLEPLRLFLGRTIPHPPVVAIVGRHAPKSLLDKLYSLLGHGLRDFLFDDEHAIFSRTIRRILAEESHSLPTEAAHPLSETPHLLSGFLQASPLAIIAVKPDGNVGYWNRAAEQLFGWHSQELIGKPLPTILANSQYYPSMELQMQAVSTEGTEVIRVCKDGSLIHVNLWTAPVVDSYGRIKAKLAFFADVTGRRGERLQLMESERAARKEVRDMNRFRELLDAAPDAIIEVDAHGKITLMNAITEQLFGYSRDELLGQSVDLLVPDDLRHQHAAHRARYANHPVTRPMGIGLQLSGRRKDGVLFPIEISLSPVKSSKGLRVSAIIRDVSERKRAEERLQEVRDKFTSELAAANREMELRNREIERANRLKSEFLASMSHELRTPLHTIVGFSELLGEELDGPLNAKQKRFVNHIRNDSFHLLELINDILDLSKIEAGKLDLHSEPFDASAALDEVLSSIAPLAAAKSISVEHVLFSPLMVQADRVRFKQIFYNLLSNAVKFTAPSGQISITSSVNGSSAQFSVNDSGIGIPQEEQAAIFEKFHQVGSTTKGVREGTGLGLAISRHLVERLGGTIWVESQEGKGSNFHFTVPCCADRQPNTTWVL